MEGKQVREGIRGRRCRRSHTRQVPGELLVFLVHLALQFFRVAYPLCHDSGWPELVADGLNLWHGESFFRELGIVETTSVTLLSHDNSMYYLLPSRAVLYYDMFSFPLFRLFLQFPPAQTALCHDGLCPLSV